VTKAIERYCYRSNSWSWLRIHLSLSPIFQHCNSKVLASESTRTVSASKHEQQTNQSSRALRLRASRIYTMRKKATSSKAKATPLKTAARRASKAAKTPNGTPKSTVAKTPSKTPKSPAAQPSQPAELSEEDRARLREWLEYTDRPFSVQTVPSSRKRKRSGTNQLQVQDDLFEERLSVQYEVKPRDKWESLRRYKKFTGKRRRTWDQYG